ncbi:hypothetical protein CONCODRAFT_18845 [Conidiobolus coronatus NRRL 28638]|uniref:Extracellular membrane protein CFEM domain-containing protein n=1 Tax=Conidiobolus coronatus (strain ATCC 28846 / CBS 209.66 / NRRL 28638) TaxID=796925 RepID=A0A137P0W3_CONC2|nr:hypothetical protein CONCODRAFT_18845 [Conidiobolus coronatus NRRL 28638]|eukprot:KXN68713.1 hypothetical protein CONCODRAFT_18845 [Conidiobolus coronatus NRRL 28638]
MKFATTFLLLTSLIVALPSEEKKETTPAPCVNKLVCKIEEQKASKDNADKLKECEAKKEEADKAKCTFSTLGFKDEQIEKVSKLQSPFKTCATSSNTNLKTCADKCTGDKKDECTKKCTAEGAEEFSKCAIKESGLKEFDAKKAGECSTTKCTQTSLSEIFDCEYTCNKELFDALVTKAGDSKDDKSKDDKSKDDKTKEEGKDDKAKDDKTKDDKAKDDKTKDGKAKDEKSSAMTNFGMTSFGAMAVGTILSALLI